MRAGGHVYTLVIISAEVRCSATAVRTCIGVRFKTTANLWESEASARATRANQRDKINKSKDAATRSGKNMCPTSVYHYASRVVSMTG